MQLRLPGLGIGQCCGRYGLPYRVFVRARAGLPTAYHASHPANAARRHQVQLTHVAWIDEAPAPSTPYTLTSVPCVGRPAERRRAYCRERCTDADRERQDGGGHKLARHAARDVPAHAELRLIGRPYTRRACCCAVWGGPWCWCWRWCGQYWHVVHRWAAPPSPSIRLLCACEPGG